ncbi:MAG: carboxypeptidase-like regulatory domain-containing protein [Ignavibacteriales bacterium]|nr:carboxypeptidase-like regulatory domain-containing protein [Ignavibacteriales bacterium]
MKVIIWLFFFISITTNIIAQTGTLKGKVVDKEYGEPLIGANVLVIGTNLGAASDIDGNYEIKNISPGTYLLRVSYIGYKTIEIDNVKIVAFESELNFELENGDPNVIISHPRYIAKFKTACTFKVPTESPIIPIKEFYFGNYLGKIKTNPPQMDSIRIKNN